jgi:acyl dehydratase
MCVAIRSTAIFHVDPAAANRSMYGDLIASGWLTCSLMMRMMVDGFLKDVASHGSPRVDEIRWIKPVRGGDTSTVTSTPAEARPSASKSDGGVVHTL